MRAGLRTRLYYDHKGNILGSGISFQEACKLSYRNPTKLLIVVEEGFLPQSLALVDLVSYCHLLILGGDAFFVCNTEPAYRSWIFKESVQCEVISRERAKQLIKDANRPKTDFIMPTDESSINLAEKRSSKTDTFGCQSDESLNGS